MPRVTITLQPRDHLALKLLALSRQQKMVQVMEDALRSYLKHSGAYRLGITSIKPTDTGRGDNDDERQQL